MDKLKEMLPDMSFTLANWYRTWAPICTTTVFACATVLLIVENTHFPNSKCEIGGRVANHIKDKCALYKQASKLNTTGILTYGTPDSHYKLMIEADTTGSSVKLMQQDNTPTTGSGIYHQKTTLSSLNVAMQAAFLGDTQLTFSNKLTQITSKYVDIVNKCDEWESPNVLTMLWHYIDLAEATNVLQAMSLQLFIFSAILACHAYLTRIGDIPEGRGLNNTAFVPSLISAAILLGVMVATAAAYGAGEQKDSYHDRNDWTWAVTSACLWWGCILLVITFFRFCYTTKAGIWFKTYEPAGWPIGQHIYILVYRILSNFLHIWLACIFLLCASLITLMNMSKGCEEVHDIYDALDNMHSYIQNTMNKGGNTPVTGWSSSSAALYSQAGAFERSGSCKGLMATGITLFIPAATAICACIVVVVYEQYNMGSWEKLSIKEKAAALEEKMRGNEKVLKGQAEYNADTEMHPLNADTLSF